MAMDGSFIQLDHLDTDFVVINDNLEVGESELTSMEKLVSEQATALQNCNAEVDRLRDEVSMKTASLVKKEEAYAQLQAQMVDKVMALAQLEREINRKNAELAEKDAIIAEKDNALAEKNAELFVECKRKDEELGSLKCSVISKTASLAQQAFDIARLESMVEVNASALAEKDAWLDERDKQISYLQSGLDAKMRALEQSHAQVRSLQAQIATMALAAVQENPNSRSLVVQNYSRTSLVRKVSESSLLPKTNKALKIMVGFPLALALANAPNISSLAWCTFPMKHHEYGSRFICNPMNEAAAVTKALLNTDVNSGGLFSIQNDSFSDSISTEPCFNGAAVSYKPLQAQDLSTTVPARRAIVTAFDKSGHAIVQKKLPSFRILSNDHVKGEKVRGRYFNFKVAHVERILGRRLAKHGERLPLFHLESGKIAMAVMWRTANGGSCGDGHGRWDDGSKLAHFNVLDEMAILMSDLDQYS